MRLDTTAIYRHDIGVHGNKTHQYSSDKKLTTNLRTEAGKLGIAVTNNGKSTILLMLLLVSNVVESPLCPRRLPPDMHAASGRRSTGLCPSPAHGGTTDTLLPLANKTAAPFKKYTLPAPGVASRGKGIASRHPRKAGGRNATGRQPCRPRQRGGISHITHPRRIGANVNNAAPDEMPLTRNMAAMERRVQDCLLRIKAFLDSITSFPQASAVTLPPGVAADESLTVIHPDNLYYPKSTGIETLSRQNAAVSDFFRDYPINALDKSNSGSNRVRQAVSYLAADEKNIHVLARTLLNPVAYYGGGEGENIPDNVAGMVVRRWIHFNVLNDTFENFFAEYLSKHQNIDSITLSSLGAGLKKVLTDFTDDTPLRDGAEVNRLLAERLWAWTIVPELPVLAYWQEMPYENIRLLDFDLGEAQAGLIFARQSGIDINVISFEEAVELGKFVQVQVEENLAPAQWLLFYQLPALAKFIASGKGSSQGDSHYASIVYDALNLYFERKERYLEANNPFNELAVAMANYKSRTTLAQEIVNKSCPLVSASEYLLKITPTCPEPSIQLDDDHIAVSYTLHRAGGPAPALLSFYPDNPGDAVLPNIDDVFIAQNKAIAEKYSAVERLLLSHAWGAYFSTDDNHWRNIIVDKYLPSEALVNPKFGFKYCHKRWFRESPALYDFSAEHAKIIMDPDNELFAVDRFEQPIFYALSRFNEGYLIIYLTPLEKTASFKFSRSAVSVCLLKSKSILAKSHTFEQLIKSLVADHEGILLNKLYDAGYDKHFLHITKDFFLSLIPFYSCIDGITEDDVEETLFDCALDIASLIPVVSQLNRLSAKSGTLFLQGLHTAGRNALSMAAARYTMKQIATKSVKTLMVNALQPASKIVSLKEMSALAKSTARFLDPGFEIIYFVGKKSFNQAASAGRQMGKSLPKLKALFDRTTDAPMLLRQPEHISPIFIAAEQGTGRKIGIQPLTEQKYRGRAVYAMANPETGVLFGPKLFLTKKNHLRAIPAKFSTKINNVLQQGLSGRGAPRAAATWGADSHGTAGSSRAADSAVPPGASSRFHAVDTVKAPRRDYNSHGLFVDQNEIRARNDGKATSVIYDLTHNVFYPRHDKTKVKSIIEQFPEKEYSIDPVGRLKKTTVPSLAPATPSEQYKGIQALGVDLMWDRAPIKISPETKQNIPRKITSIWVGKNDIPDDIVKNLQKNALQAKEFPRPHEFKLYLSSRDEGSFQRNMERLKRLAKNVVVINLEFTDYYHAFSQTKNYEHYLAAIDGNGGKATNFASACDVIRLDLLNRRGGLYMDVDDTLLISPGTFELKTHPEGLILSSPVYHKALDLRGKYPNSNWGTHANNPTLGAMLEESYQRYMSHKDLYQQRPPLADEFAVARYTSTLSYVSGPNLFNHVIDQRLASEKQTREALKLYNLPVVMDSPTYARLEEYLDLEVCVLHDFIGIGNAHTWRHSR